MVGDVVYISGMPFFQRHLNGGYIRRYIRYQDEDYPQAIEYIESVYEKDNYIIQVTKDKHHWELYDKDNSTVIATNMDLLGIWPKSFMVSARKPQKKNYSRFLSISLLFVVVFFLSSLYTRSSDELS